MKSLPYIFVIYLLHLSCNNISGRTDPEYVKIITLYSADSLTRYNRGVGLGDYACFNLKNDSVILRLFTNLPGMDMDSRPLFGYRTFVGQAKRSLYYDTIADLVHLLKRYPNGDINSNSIMDGALYSGPEFFIEFRDFSGLHYYTFVLDGNDTLKRFSRFFYDFENLPWKKDSVSNHILNGDSIAVASMQRMGLYENRETPYLPATCAPEIDYSKIVGIWRTPSTLNLPDSSSYYQLTFKKDGKCSKEFIRKGISNGKKMNVRYRINKKNNKIIFWTENGQFEYNILKLSDECLEFKKTGEDSITRYYRIGVSVP